MQCPKCRGAMSSYERNGITIDQCTECRGIFLDRGELERLIDAEAAFATRSAPAAAAAPQPYQQQPQQYQQGYQYPQHGYHDQRDSDYYKRRDKHRRHRGGFLGELFD